MNAMDRLWSLGAGIVAIAVVAGVWFGVASPDLTAAARADAERENVEMQNHIHETRLIGLEEAAARMDEFAAARDELAQGVPADVEYSTVLRELQRLATQTGVVLQVVTTSDAVIYASPVETSPEPAPAEDAAADEAGAAEELPDAADAVAAQLPGGDGELPAPVPYADPLIHSDNLAAIPVSISAQGDVTALFNFLRLVQTGERLYSVSTVTIAEASETEPAMLDTSGYLYALHGLAPTP